MTNPNDVIFKYNVIVDKSTKILFLWNFTIKYNFIFYLNFNPRKNTSAINFKFQSVTLTIFNYTMHYNCAP